MPVIHVEMWKGRTVEQKNELSRAIIDSMVNIIKVRPESVQIIFSDVEKENWIIGGK